MLNRALVTFCTLALAAVQSLANPSGINISGKIAVQGTNSPLASSDVDFRIRVLSPTGCILYTERFDNVDLASTNGVFNLTIGQGVVDYNAWDSNPATRYTKNSLIKVFNNAAATVPSGLTTYGSGTCIGGQYAPQDGDVRQIVIEFDPSGSGIPANYVALSPYHQIRSVPYAMLADHAADSSQLGGVPAAQYAKTADIPAAVASSETDPSVQAFAKSAITGLTAGQCGAGKVLSFNGTSLECVTDATGGGGGSLTPATDTVLGGVIVPSASYVSVDGSGNVNVKDLPTSKITGLDTALAGKFDASQMPATSCGAGQALVWQSPANTFACYTLSLTASQISDFNTAVDARVNAGAFLPTAGGTMTGDITMSGAGTDINMGNNLISNVGYLHFQNKTSDPVFSAGNNGYVWYNSTDKKLKFNDGTQIQEIGLAGAGASPTGTAGGDLDGTYPNPTLAVLGAGGTGTKITYDTKGRVTASASLAATDIPALDAAKITTGQFGDAQISGVAVDKITSASGKYFTYAPNGNACVNGEVLKKTANGWECAPDAGAGGADADTIKGAAVSATAPSEGNFMKYTAGAWTPVAMPSCTADQTLIFNVTGVASCTAISGLTNSAIAAGAAIARSKIASGTANHVVINDGSGAFSSEAQLSVSRGGTGQNTYTDGQLLIGKSDGTLAKANLTAGAGVSITNGDGSITIASSGSAPTGTAGGDLDGTYPNPTLAVLGAGGTGTKITYDTKGRVTASASLAATDIPALDAAKITTGQFGDARLSDISVDKITSASGKYFTYAPNGNACTNGEILKKTANGWECAPDAGAGGADADTIKGAAVSATAPSEGNFMKYTAGAWTPVAMPSCGADDTLTFDITGVAACTPIAGLTNSAIAAGAAIARTKIATGTANHVVINDGSGAFSSEAQLSVSRGGTGQSTYTDGQLLIGKSDGTLAKATLTAGSGVSITNGDGSITIASSGSAPTGSAGGDLAGTYPNPTLAALGAGGTGTKITYDTKGRVTASASLAATDIPALDAAKITTGQFGDARLSDISVDKVSSASGKYFTYAPNGNACTNGEILKKTANGWECAADSGGAGSVTSVTSANADIAITNTTTTPQLTLNTGTSAGQVLKFVTTGTLPALDGSALTNLTRANISNGTANHVLINNGSGAMSSEAQLATSRGGTGQSSYTAGQLLIGKSDGTLAKATLTAGSNVTITNGDGTITIASSGAPSVLTTLGDIAVHNGTTTVRLPAGTNGQALVADNTAPEGIKWAAITASDIASLVGTGIVQRTGAGAYTALGLASPLAVVGSDITVGTELTGLSGLSSDGYVYRNGAGTYATRAGNDAASNSTVVLRDASGISGFSGVKITNGTTNVTQAAASGGGSYSMTWPNALPGASGKVLSIDTSGILSWIDMAGSSNVTTTEIVNGTILDADISASAAIARTKLASGTANHVLINDASGVMSSEAALAVSRGGTGQTSYTNGQLLIGRTTGNTLVKATLTAGTGINITNGSGSITIASDGTMPGLTNGRIWVGDGTGTATERTPAGDATMTNTGSFTVTKLQGTAVSATAPTTGQLMQYSGTNWSPVSPTTTGAANSVMKLDASGVANSYGVGIKGATTGIASIIAPNSFTSYQLTLPADDGNANQVLTTNGSGTLTWSSPSNAPTIATKTADFNVQTTENNYFYLISNATTATLPSVGSVPAGFQLTFKRVGGHNVNIAASGAETIDGANQRSLASTYQTMVIINTGSEWAIISGGAAATSPGCVPGSQAFNSAGSYSFSIDASRASLCKFTVTVQGGGGGNGASSASGGRGGALRLVYTAPSDGIFEVLVGGAGALTGSAGYGGGGAGGNGTTNAGAGGGGASAVRFRTSAPTDTLLAIAGGGGGGGAFSASNDGGDGGSTGGGSNGATSGSNEYGRAGIANVGGAGGTAASYNGGAGGSAGASGSAGQNALGGAGGTGFAAFLVSGGGGGSVSSSGYNGAGGGGGGYGGGGGGAGGGSALGGGAGGGGYVYSGVDSFTSLTGPAPQNPGSVLIEWN